MSVRVHWGASTQVPPFAGGWVGGSDGSIRLRWSGVWQTPSYMRMRVGGNWVDSGYRAFPNPPSDPWVNSWDYSNVQAAWNYAAGGGAPISYYEVQLLNASGGLWASENSTDNVSPNWGIGQDARAQIRVRSVGVNGLTSAWSNLLRVGTGHPSTPNYGYVQRTQDWNSDLVGGARNADDPFWVGVPGGVLLNAMHISNYYTPMSGVVARGTNRDVNWVLYGNDYGSVVNNYGTLYSGGSISHPLNNWGDGSPWGWIARGAGWSTTGNGYYMLWIEQLWLSGTYYYDNYEIVSWNPEQGNYYW